MKTFVIIITKVQIMKMWGRIQHTKPGLSKGLSNFLQFLPSLSTPLGDKKC